MSESTSTKSEKSVKMEETSSTKSEKVMKTGETSSTKALVMKYVRTAADSTLVPPQVQPYLLKAAPILGDIVDFIEKVIPIIQEWYQKAVDLWEKLKPYRLELLIPSFIGFVMCFFGGNFLTIIAAVEAYKMCGYETTVQCIQHLIEDFQKVADANKKDDSVDADGDGVSDTLQISNKELAKRKTFLFLRTIDPQRITEAFAGIQAGFLAVIATLKLEFAKTITLGNSIAVTIEEPVDRYVVPRLEGLLAPEYKKWAKPVCHYTIKSIAISIAWTIQRVISAFHSAIRGGLMFSRNILHYLTEMDYVKINHEETYIDEIVGFAVAALGLMWQLRSGFTLPFPLNWLLLPFTILEKTLIWIICSK